MWLVKEAITKRNVTKEEDWEECYFKNGKKSKMEKKNVLLGLKWYKCFKMPRRMEQTLKLYREQRGGGGVMDEAADQETS